MSWKQTIAPFILLFFFFCLYLGWISYPKFSPSHNFFPNEHRTNFHFSTIKNETASNYSPFKLKKPLNLCLLVVGSSIIYIYIYIYIKARWGVKDSTKIHLENFLARIYGQLRQKKIPCFLLPIIVSALKPITFTQHLTRLHPSLVSW
jgi:hypothetical protein